MSETKQRKVRLPNFIEALFPILVMMGLMIYGLNFSNEVYYDAHMPLVVSIVVACIIGTLCGHSFSDMLAGMIERLNATMCDQFLGIGVPAPLYEDKYDEMGLSRNMLSRTLEDCGTLWAVMFPWTGCGAYQQSVLGMSPFVYFPFAFVNLLNPIYAAITAYMGRNIFWADGAYTNIFGKTTLHKPAAAPEEAHERALKNLEALRAAGKAPVPTGKAAAKV